ncbi:uncharacterized protein LOC118479144 [Aplysia californica]|uniref:Uncharacterized protein LOC118479144 n=1 Tax=Aplysia californica TaxID=6500 RepID=A0ABM1W4R7_APLCA|nr:uncharacterized protein LOC118479144 [Aplysia californica]
MVMQDLLALMSAARPEPTDARAVSSPTLDHEAASRGSSARAEVKRSRPGTARSRGEVSGSRPGTSRSRGEVNRSRPSTSRHGSATAPRPPSTFSSRLSDDLSPELMQGVADFFLHDDQVAGDHVTGDVTPRGSGEGRLSRSLKAWMPAYRMRSLPPQPHPPRQPVFSARLGDQMKIKRADSTESVNTLISLFSCSSHGSHVRLAPRRRRRRKRLTTPGGGEVDRLEDGTSVWVQLASKPKTSIDRMLQMHAMYAQMDTETEIFKRLPEEERQMVTRAGHSRGVQLGPARQRSDSASNVHKKMAGRKKKLTRAQSAGGHHDGPMINFLEMRRQIVNQRIAAMQQQNHSSQRAARLSSRRSLGTRSLSRQSLTSSGSNEPWPSNTPRNLSPLDLESELHQDDPVSVWKGDSQILAIDLKRGLTAKVKSRIMSTTTALERATGYGDDNEARTYVGPLEEYPGLVEEDYSHVAKIPQRLRISPHLSNVIRTDIHVRMGRPRYHEIREKDLVMWDRGQFLDRAHRNLKVFNWLHSLKESDFDMRIPEAVEDTPPGCDVTTRDEVVVSVDDPKIKPLFERLKTQYIV